MAGIYIHIPFCRRRCHYCDFYSSVKVSEKNDIIQSIVKEAGMQQAFLKDEKINTVYFGGGTPSILSKDEIGHLLQAIKEKFSVEREAEITLEANPEQLNVSFLKEMTHLGINRLSIGVQSFFDDDLKLLNRVHTARQSIEAVEQAYALGFRNITIDLIYGLPGMTLERWENNIEKALSLPIVHLSAYHLTIEEGTAFHTMQKKNKIREISEEESMQQFRALIKATAKAGFEHYEISNFAREGFYSRHNSSYWTGEKYLGLGPSAHSFDGNIRRWNISNNTEYIKKIFHEDNWYDEELLSEKDKANEKIMISLRTKWGLNLKDFEKQFGKQVSDHIVEKVQPFLKSEEVILMDSILYLSNEGKMRSDLIIKELFM